MVEMVVKNTASVVIWAGDIGDYGCIGGIDTGIEPVGGDPRGPEGLMDGEHPEIPAGRQAPCGGGQGGSADFGRPFSVYRTARPFNMGASFFTSTPRRTSLVFTLC